MTEKFSEVKFVTMDAGYKTPWIAKKVPEDMNYGIRPQAKKGNGLTAALPKAAKTVPAELVSPFYFFTTD